MKLLAEDVPAFFDMCFAGKAPVKLNSKPGSGKSKQAKAYARRMNKKYAHDGGYGFFVLDMSKANLADIMGYLMPEKETRTDHNGVTTEVLTGKYTYPFFLYDEDTGRPASEFKRGMIVLEEWGQGGREEKKACAPIILDRRLGLWTFPDFDIVILSNRPEDRSGVTPEFDFLINRWVEADLVPTLNGFLIVGQELGMTMLTLAFAKRVGDKLGLFEDGVPEKQGPWLTQRSLHKFDDIIQANASRGIDIDHPLMLVAASGAMGDEAAHAYIAFAAARSKLPAIREIVADPHGCRIPDDLDVMMFLVFDLASKVDHSNVDEISTYVKRLPADMATTFFFTATRRDDTLVGTKHFSSFAIQNQALLSAVAMRGAMSIPRQ